MPQVAVQVPGGLAPCIRDTVLLLYRAAVEALHLAFGVHGETSASLEEVKRHRGRVTQVGSILDQVGWPGEPVADAVEVVGPPDVLRDALHGSLIDAGERLAVACGGSWRGEAGAEAIRSAAREVIDLDRLLARVEPSEGR